MRTTRQANQQKNQTSLNKKGTKVEFKTDKYIKFNNLIYVIFYVKNQTLILKCHLVLKLGQNNFI